MFKLILVFNFGVTQNMVLIIEVLEFQQCRKVTQTLSPISTKNRNLKEWNHGR